MKQNKVARGLSDDDYATDELESDSECELEGEEGELGEVVAREKFATFVQPKNMRDYKWEEGTYFVTKKSFTEAVRTYSVHSNRMVKFVKNDKRRIRGKCQGAGCNWEIYSFYLRDKETWQLRKVSEKHDCPREPRVNLLSSDWLSNRLQSTVKENPAIKLTAIVERTQKKWNNSITKGMAYRAKEKAVDLVNGGTNCCSLYTFISDQQKGLLPAIDELLPGVDQRFCVRHLYNNFRKRFPGKNLKLLMWRAANATYPQAWKREMDEIKKDNLEAFKEPGMLNKKGMKQACRRCGETGHNKSTCKLPPPPPPPPTPAATTTATTPANTPPATAPATTPVIAPTNASGAVAATRKSPRHRDEVPATQPAMPTRKSPRNREELPATQPAMPTRKSPRNREELPATQPAVPTTKSPVKRKRVESSTQPAPATRKSPIKRNKTDQTATPKNQGKAPPKAPTKAPTKAPFKPPRSSQKPPFKP
ncbi:hypothetical protein P8452_76472 [Trifolium repens]|nr:hypothetical protein P8452_76472 [Trifolium repens]